MVFYDSKWTSVDFKAVDIFGGYSGRSDMK